MRHSPKATKAIGPLSPPVRGRPLATVVVGASDATAVVVVGAFDAT